MEPNISVTNSIYARLTMGIEISAIICTRNNASYLQKSLASLVSQTLPKETFEIIIVDNGSTDNTRQVVKAFQRLKNIRYIYDPVIGLSQARNTGWMNASGKYIAYLDDDAIAGTNWLKSITDKFKSVVPRPMSVGGKITPIWEAERPEWLLKEMETYIGIIDWSEEPMFLTDDRFYLSGSNLSYRRKVLEKSKGFNTSLGRKGLSLLSNEEIFMQKYMRRHNLAIWYDPEICIQHHVKPQCLSKRWLCRRFYWQGVSDAILEYQVSVQNGEAWQYLPRVTRDAFYLLMASEKYIRARFAKPNNWVIAKCWTYHWLGRLFTNTRIATGKL
jgi:glycosyltransferase involved in cell wall biosynthesis